jgi:hypothetical protein
MEIYLLNQHIYKVYCIKIELGKYSYNTIVLEWFLNFSYRVVWSLQTWFLIVKLTYKTRNNKIIRQSNEQLTSSIRKYEQRNKEQTINKKITMWMITISNNNIKNRTNFSYSKFESKFWARKCAIWHACELMKTWNICHEWHGLPSHVQNMHLWMTSYVSIW